MAANIKRGADGLNPKSSTVKGKSTPRSDAARIDFLMGVVRMLHENALGKAETESVFDNDTNRALTEPAKSVKDKSTDKSADAAVSTNIT